MLSLIKRDYNLGKKELQSGPYSFTRQCLNYSLKRELKKYHILRGIPCADIPSSPAADTLLAFPRRL